MDLIRFLCFVIGVLLRFVCGAGRLSKGKKSEESL